MVEIGFCFVCARNFTFKIRACNRREIIFEILFARFRLLPLFLVELKILVAPCGAISSVFNKSFPPFREAVYQVIWKF